ncbi:MAG: sel1 repeat family protein [Lachnospiraceae bacterium]|nr:sel1 repeat family protein [Lachnospiraceae bacterium]
MSEEKQFSQGDWVTIKFGEFMGKYGKVVRAESDGSILAIPYNVPEEDQSAASFQPENLELIEPYMFDEDALKALVRGEMFYRDVAENIFPPFNAKAAKDYILTAADIAEAIRNINTSDDRLELFKEWFWLIINLFYNDLHIEGRYKEDEISDNPKEEDELFSTVFDLTSKLYWRLEERFSLREEGEKYVVRFKDEINWGRRRETNNELELAAYNAVCEDIISRVEVFEKNKRMPEGEHIYSLSEKRHIVNSYETDEDLEKASPEELKQYKQFVFDLYHAGDTQAIKILAWGYYEGDAVFEQNWYLAERFLQELLKKTGDPFAANSLGYIYYYGRTNYGIPDYERAFSNFMFGALSGIDESTYKCGDMLIEGRGTTKNIDMGMNLIVEGYRDALQRFCEGEYDCKFADYALRMGNICRNGLVYEMGIRDAYKFYLEAAYAIRKRRAAGDFYGDDAVERRIDAEVRRIQEDYELDTNADVLRADYPIFINLLFEDRYPIKVTINANLEARKGTLKLQRFRLGGELVEQGIISEDSDVSKLITPPSILTAYPELSWAELTTELFYELENLSVAKKPDKEGFFLCDGFRRNDRTGALEFFAGGEVVAAIDTEWFVIRKREKRNE